MKMRKGGIYKTVDEQDVQHYLDKGFKPTKCIEPQPSQDGLYVIDDYTIGRLDSIHIPTH